MPAGQQLSQRPTTLPTAMHRLGRARVHHAARSIMESGSAPNIPIRDHGTHLLTAAVAQPSAPRSAPHPARLSLARTCTDSARMACARRPSRPGASHCTSASSSEMTSGSEACREAMASAPGSGSAHACHAQGLAVHDYAGPSTLSAQNCKNT